MQLSNKTRDLIVNGAVCNLMKNRREKIEQLKLELFDLLIDFYIKNSCPIEENSKSKTNFITIRMSKSHYKKICIQSNKYTIISCNFKYLESSYSSVTNGLYFHYEDLEDLYKNKTEYLEKKIDSLSDYEIDLKSELKNLVYGCNTDKQLKELFPDIETISGVKLNNEYKSLVKLDLSKLNNLIHDINK